MKNWSTEYSVQEWDQNMAKLRARILRIRNEVRDAYRDQLKIDVQDIIKTSGSSSNEHLMNVIYNFVVEKYDWRYWFVAVYKQMYGTDYHVIEQCGGHVFFRQKGKNIVVSSQDKEYSSRFKKAEADVILQSVENDVKNCVSGLRNPEYRANALNGHAVRKSDPGCLPYALHMTVKSGYGLSYRSSLDNHLSYRKIYLREVPYRYHPRMRPFYRSSSNRYRRIHPRLRAHSQYRALRQPCRLQTIWHYEMIIFG